MRYFWKSLGEVGSDIRLLPHGPLIVHTTMFVCALTVCAAIGVAVNGMMRVPEVTAMPVIRSEPQPRPPGKLQDRHPSMLKQDSLQDTLTAADRAIVAPPSSNPSPIGQGRLVVSQKPVVPPIPYADPYADLNDPPATFAERWDAVMGDAQNAQHAQNAQPVVAATKPEKPPVAATLPVTPVRPVRYERKPVPAAVDWGDETEQELVTPARPAKRSVAVPRKERAQDVCERHGLEKQWRRGGRSWRCR